jgi:hypothetical protein
MLAFLFVTAGWLASAAPVQSKGCIRQPEALTHGNDYDMGSNAPLPSIVALEHARARHDPLCRADGGYHETAT